MNDRFRTPPFDEIQITLSRAGSLSQAAEVHGLLVGMYCADQSLSMHRWLGVLQQELSDVAALQADGRVQLESLFTATGAALADETFGFEPLLPDAEDSALDERAEALGAWCQGFIYGLGREAADRIDALGADAREYLADLREIAQVGFDADDPSEDDEAAYAEVVEYVRMGALLVHASLAPRTTHDAPALLQ